MFKLAIEIHEEIQRIYQRVFKIRNWLKVSKEEAKSEKLSRRISRSGSK